MGNVSLGLQPPKSQASLSPDGLGPVERGQENQTPLDGLLAGGSYGLARRVEGQAGQSRDALPLQPRCPPLVFSGKSEDEGS